MKKLLLPVFVAALILGSGLPRILAPASLQSAGIMARLDAEMLNKTAQPRLSEVLNRPGKPDNKVRGKAQELDPKKVKHAISMMFMMSIVGAAAGKS